MLRGGERAAAEQAEREAQRGERGLRLRSAPPPARAAPRPAVRDPLAVHRAETTPEHEVLCVRQNYNVMKIGQKITQATRKIFVQ